MAATLNLIFAGCLTPGPTLRAQVEALAEFFLDAAHHLVAFLDEVDGDPCLEVEEHETGAHEWCGSGAHRYDMGEAA